MVNEEPFDPFASDIWSLGACLYILLTGRSLYTSPQDNSFELISKGRVRYVIESYETFGLILPFGAKEVVCSMMDNDPRKRPTLEELRCHTFLQDRQEDMTKA